MLTLSSPAKLNLFLHTVKKRDDGFTELVSFFQAVDLMDRISFQQSDQDTFTCSDSTIPTDSSNTVIRALHLFRKKTNLDFSINIHLEKQIPSLAGLGGGSGNAATTLWALNCLMKQKLSNETLALWGSEIGSDVPFFFSNGQAIIRGRGEIVQPVLSDVPFSAWLAKPRFGLSTPKVFKALDFSKLPKRDMKKSLSLSDCQYFNDLEIPALSIEPRLQTIKTSLLDMGFDQVVMTGSGTAFFCLGNIKPKEQDDLVFYSIKNTQRNLSSWY